VVDKFIDLIAVAPGQANQSQYLTYDVAGNVLRLTDNPDASLASHVNTGTFDALSRPVS